MITNIQNGIVYTNGYYPQDAEGNNVTRTKWEYPYSYDPFITYKKRKPSKKTNSIYSDRILQWDYSKARSLMLKHFKTDGDYYYDRTPSDIQNFLRDFLNDNSIELVYIMEGCNVSNGYPYWVFGIESKGN